MLPPRKYVCQFCAKAFSRSEHKLRHERLHTREKPFHCLLCDATFVRRDLLQRHCRTVHGTVILFNTRKNLTAVQIARALEASGQHISRHDILQRGVVVARSDQSHAPSHGPLLHAPLPPRLPLFAAVSTSDGSLSGGLPPMLAPAPPRRLLIASLLDDRLGEPHGLFLGPAAAIVAVRHALAAPRLLRRYSLEFPPHTAACYATTWAAACGRESPVVRVSRMANQNTEDPANAAWILAAFCWGAAEAGDLDQALELLSRCMLSLGDLQHSRPRDALYPLTVVAHVQLHFKVLAHTPLVQVMAALDRAASTAAQQGLSDADDWWQPYLLLLQHLWATDGMVPELHTHASLQMVAPHQTLGTAIGALLAAPSLHPDNGIVGAAVVTALMNEVRARTRSMLRAPDLLHNAVILANRLWNPPTRDPPHSDRLAALETARLQQQLHTLHQVARQRLSLDCLARLQDLISQYDTVPLTPMQWHLMCATLRENHGEGCVPELLLLASDSACRRGSLRWTQLCAAVRRLVHPPLAPARNNLAIVLVPMLVLGLGTPNLARFGLVLGLPLDIEELNKPHQAMRVFVVEWMLAVMAVVLRLRHTGPSELPVVQLVTTVLLELGPPADSSQHGWRGVDALLDTGNAHLLRSVEQAARAWFLLVDAESTGVWETIAAALDEAVFRQSPMSPVGELPGPRFPLLHSRGLLYPDKTDYGLPQQDLHRILLPPIVQETALYSEERYTWGLPING